MADAVRLQKYMAECGVASRRASEELILSARVKVNGTVVTELGTKVSPECDTVTVDDIPIRPEKKKYYILLNKPSGYVTTASDPYGRNIVTQLVTDISARLYPVGRLDYDTEGALILTNDGDFSNRIMHPKNKIAKTYEARIGGLLKAAEMHRLTEGIVIDGKKTAPAQVKVLRDMGKTSLVSITITEGRNRQVKRMFATVGHPVLELKRVSVGIVKLGSLPLGKWRHLSDAEVRYFLS